MASWRAWKALLHDAVDGVTHLVGEGNASTARIVVRAVSLLPPLAAPARAVDRVRELGTNGVLGTVRGANRLVEWTSDQAIDLLSGEAASPPASVPMRADAVGTAPWVDDAFAGVVNGVLGDHLQRRGSALDLGLRLRVLAERAPSGRIAVWVHGLAATEWSWCLNADRTLGQPTAHFGALLERDLGFTPVFARYNSGRHISENATALAQAIEELARDWPVPIEEIVLVGHSMGGLVARGAIDRAHAQGLAWERHLHRLVCIGSPHQGAPLERLGVAVTSLLQGIDLPGTRITAAILRARSAGIQDLRHGELGGEVTAGGPLLPHVHYAFLAGAIGTDPHHPLAATMGDLLVPIESAIGPNRATDGARVHAARFGGVAHQGLQTHPAIYEELRAFCAGERDQTGGPMTTSTSAAAASSPADPRREPPP